MTAPPATDNVKQGFRKPLDGRDVFYHKPIRTADFFKSRTGLRTQELLRLLWGAKPSLSRRPDEPRKRIDLQVFTPSGRPAVDICFG
jgi:hypothetical protein